MTIDTPTETPLLPLSELTNIAASYRHEIDAERDFEERIRIAHEIGDAVAAAHAHVGQRFPATLARVLSYDAWTGYSEGDRHDRAEPGRQHLAIAVAYIGEGMWLRHLVRAPGDEDANRELEVISLCPCGEYVAGAVVGDYTLAHRLEDAQRRRDTGACDCPT